MPRFTKAWEDYKSDYPQRKIKDLKAGDLRWTNTRREKMFFVNEHDGVEYYVTLSEDGYEIEKVPQEFWFL